MPPCPLKYLRSKLVRSIKIKERNLDKLGRAQRLGGVLQRRWAKTVRATVGYKEQEMEANRIVAEKDAEIKVYEELAELANSDYVNFEDKDEYSLLDRTWGSSWLPVVFYLDS